MKTSKFSYTVYCYPLVKENDSIFQQPQIIQCVTLAEARFVAARYYRASIRCTGEIQYLKGIEVNGD